jgi:hypothetical protein
VPLSVNILQSSGYAGDEAFWKKLTDQGIHLGNTMFLCSASGKGMEGQQDLHNLGRWYRSWLGLPDSERRPGAFQVEERGTFNPMKGPPQPPEGSLVLRAFLRGLARDAEGRLYAPEKMAVGISNTLIRAEPQRDFVWITAEERHAFAQANGKPGDSLPVPESFRSRFIRFHLVDGPITLPHAWSPKEVLSNEMKLVILESNAQAVTMRLDGSARVGKDETHAHDFRIRGYISYDRTKNTFTRFDMVALSLDAHFERKSETQRPLGIACELTDAASAAGSFPHGVHLVGKDRYLNGE